MIWGRCCSGKLKYYFAAYDYKNVVISDNKIDYLSLIGHNDKSISSIKELYRDRVQQLLRNSFGSDYFKSLNSKAEKISFNGNRTKTFCSLSIPMPIFSNEDEFLNIFINGINSINNKALKNLQEQIIILEREFLNI